MRRLWPVLLLVTACRGAPAPEPFTLRFAVPGAIGVFGPAPADRTSGLAAALVFEPLLRPGPSGPTSGVLEAWPRAGDGLRLTLRAEVRLADGSVAAPADLADSLGAAGFRAAVDGAEVVVTSPGGAMAPSDLYQVGLGRRAQGGWIGTRPFRLAAAGPGELLLERLRPAPGRVARVRFLAFPDARTAFVQLLRGDADAMIGLDDRMAQLLEGVDRLRLVRGESPFGLAVGFDSRRLGAAERRALVAWMPRAELAAAAQEGCAPFASGGGPLPPGRRLDVLAATADPGGALAGLALRRALGPRGGAFRTAAGRTALPPEARGGFDLLLTVALVWPEDAAQRRWCTDPLLRGEGAGRQRSAALAQGDAAELARAVAEDPPLVPICRQRRLAAVDARVRNPSLGDWDALESLPGWEVAR